MNETNPKLPEAPVAGKPTYGQGGVKPATVWMSVLAAITAVVLAALAWKSGH